MEVRGALLAVTVGICCPASARTIVVQTSISDALAGAKLGDVIQVPPGAYRECLTIKTKNVTLIGSGRDETLVQCGATVLSTDGDNIVVRGFTFSKVQPRTYGPAVQLRGGGTLASCRVKMNGDPRAEAVVEIRADGEWRIEDNELLGKHGNIVYVRESGGGLHIVGNQIGGGARGVQIDSIGRATIEDNEIVPESGIEGIYVLEAGNVRIAHNLIQGAMTGLSIRNALIAIEGNLVRQAALNGMDLKGVTGKLVHNVLWQMKRGAAAFYGYGGAQITFEENTIVQCGFAMPAEPRVKASRNIIVGCEGAFGVHVEPSDNVLWRVGRAAPEGSRSRIIDPRFVAEREGDFHLAPDSPLLKETVEYGAHGKASAGDSSRNVGPRPRAVAPIKPVQPRIDRVSSVAGEPPPTLLVLDISGSKKLDPELLVGLSDRIRATVIRSDRFRVVSRDQLNAILAEQRFQKSEACDETACQAEMGRALGARYMVTGRLSLLGKTYSLTLQLVDVEKVTTLASSVKDCKGCAEDDLLSVCEAVANEVVGAR